MQIVEHTVRVNQFKTKGLGNLNIFTLHKRILLYHKEDASQLRSLALNTQYQNVQPKILLAQEVLYARSLQGDKKSVWVYQFH